MEHVTQSDIYAANPQDSPKPKIVFVGTDIDFSQHSVTAISREFPSLEPVRLTTLADVTLYTQFNDQLAAVIFAQTHAEHLIQSYDACKTVCKSVPIVMAYSDVNRAIDVFDKLAPNHGLGAVSFLPMNKSIDCWLAIVGLVLKGDTYLSAELMELSYIRNAQTKPADVSTVALGLQCSMPEPIAEESHQAGPLTTREAEVLTLVATGQQNKTIANALDVTEHTIKLHIHNLIRKLGVSNRTAAAAWYHSNAHRTFQDDIRHTADG